ncbi:MAG: anaerobic ribonucleoside-triphosphate reductase activating protein [Bacilli bacterium]|nr:anaerobic ribonucleoside-triphosphate reductase activating protein [Bacilli bacterium]
MRYNRIRKMDISNGPGIRVSIFMQGCEFHCKDCFNPETWDFKCGEEFTDETIEKVLDLCNQDHIVGLTILGGEPMHPVNIEGTTKLAKEFKKRFPRKSLWVWTGFLYEGIKDKEVFNYIDVLVDGQFKTELFSPKLRWKGSSNQRVIDIKETIKNGKIIEYKDEEY